MPSKASLPWFGDMGNMKFSTMGGKMLLVVGQNKGKCVIFYGCT